MKTNFLNPEIKNKYWDGRDTTIYRYYSKSNDEYYDVMAMGANILEMATLNNDMIISLSGNSGACFNKGKWKYNIVYLLRIIDNKILNYSASDEPDLYAGVYCKDNKIYLFDKTGEQIKEYKIP
jgi:hypothetical protein